MTRTHAIAWGALALLISTALVPGAVADPTSRDFFEYRLHRWVDGDGGTAYAGYHDELRATGRYDILDVSTTAISFRARYSWNYQDTEGLRQSGSEDRVVGFDPGTRLYTSARTDLDEYDSRRADTLSVWFWIWPLPAVGSSITILDVPFTVITHDSTVWWGGLPRDAVELRAQGSGSRADSYGQFTTSWTNTYYFDPETGFVIAERYREFDTGSWQGYSASFHLSEDFDVTATSYAMAVDPIALLVAILVVEGVLAFLYIVARAIRWRSRAYYDPTGYVRRGKIRRLWDMDKFPRLPASASEHFGEFLEDFARRGLLARDPVAVAVVQGELAGLAVYDREGKIGLVLCRDSGLTEMLRKFVGAKDFFSEVRHQVPESARKDAQEGGVKFPSENVYNVFETFHILALEPIPSASYDAHLLSRMTEADLPQVAALAKEVYKVPSARWIRAQFRSGDLGFVARVAGRPVGFAFASIAGETGRLHTATVLPEFRNAGIGKELFRARLHALRDLGIRRALTEIAHWNLASLHIAGLHGFQMRGMMYVETIRPTRIERTIVRR